MNKQMIIGGAVGALAVTAIAGIAGSGLLDAEYGDVIAVQPIAPTHEVCKDQLITAKKPVKDPNQVAGTVAGAVIGGVLGNQVGDGSGKDIATVGGAVAGGYAGNKIQEKIQDGNTEQSIRKVCQLETDASAEPIAYRVTYEFEGAQHTVQLEDDPGRRVRLEDGVPVDKS